MHVRVTQQGGDRGDLILPADDRGQRRRQRRRWPAQHHGRDRPREPLGQQHSQIIGEQFRQIIGGAEALVGRPVVGLDPCQHLRQPGLALRGGLHVDELGLVPRQEILILKTGDLLAGRHPAVLLPVDPDENLALRQIGPVQLTRGVRPRPELDMIGVRCIRVIAVRAAARSAASSVSVEDTKTRTR
jgi:hypothetical protein